MGSGREAPEGGGGMTALTNQQVIEIIENWTKYFVEHRGQIPENDVHKRLEFHEHMISGLIQLLAAAARQNNPVSHSLWLPR